ncbi:hypothetical protein OHV05_33880 [Kitasatospora sp. NBC_00070]|uniref:hypothetical protein n=1 Tax=Kitasatospora sp. NBC_00070 TaxID=2975962 RepID=UPI0032545933
MRTSWDHAHTDFSTPPTDRPVPAGLADADWHHRIDPAPNGHLLRPDGNAMLRTLASGGPVHLLHLTRSLDAIRDSGRLLASTGCLVGAVYASPLTPLPGGALLPHNLGAHLLDNTRDLDSRRGSTPLVIEITPDRPAPPVGLDYLRLGAVHLRAYTSHRHTLTEAEDDHVTRSVTDRVHAAAPLLDLLLRTATGHPSLERLLLDALADTVPVMPYLGYLYFETVAEYLMLHSTSRTSRELAARGEMNNHLYKKLAFTAVDGTGTLFDVGRFRPDHDRLLELVASVEPGLADGAGEFVRDRLAYRFAVTALAPATDTMTFTFRSADTDVLARQAPHLLGQLLFRDVRLLDRYPQLFHLFERAKAGEAWAYWNERGIATPFNGTCGPKGEIGINPAHPTAAVTVWKAEMCSRGLVHPIEQVAALPAPRLAPWVFAPLRDRTEEDRWNNRTVAPA